MPRYELRDTTTDDLYYVEGSLPLNLSGLVPLGTYRARAMSNEEPTDIVLAAVNPDYTGLSFTAGGSGVPDNLGVTYTYSGADDLVLHAVTSTVATPPGADGAAIRANIIAGTGTGNLEEFTIDPLTGSTVELVAGQLTSSSNSATYIHSFVEEKNNTGFSEVRTVAVSGLDFTAPTLSTAVATNANTVVLTFTENVFGTVATSQFAFNINGGAATITNAVRSGTTVTLTVSNTMLSTDTLNALAYTPGALEDGKGTAVAAFSGQAITNSIVGAFTDNFNRANEVLSAGANYTSIFNTNSATLNIVSNQLTMAATAGLECVKYDGSRADNQYAKIEFRTWNTAANVSDFLELDLRCVSGSFSNCYRFTIDSLGAWQIRKRTSGSNAGLASGSSLTLTAGDIVEARASGSGTTTLTLLVNGSTIGTPPTDSSSPHTSGDVAILLSRSGSGPVVVDNFEAGDL
jgi:hypothetical protein